jgi:hypothetical protein
MNGVCALNHCRHLSADVLSIPSVIEVLAAVRGSLGHPPHNEDVTSRSTDTDLHVLLRKPIMQSLDANMEKDILLWSQSSLLGILSSA